MFREVRDEISSGGSIAVAVGVAIGFAAFQLAQAAVDSLIAPVVSIFVGESRLSINSFTINGSEFMYGLVIEDVLVLLLVVVAAAYGLRWLKGSSRPPKLDPPH